MQKNEWQAAFDDTGFEESNTTPWRSRIVESAIAREKRVFRLHKSFS